MYIKQISGTIVHLKCCVDDDEFGQGCTRAFVKGGTQFVRVSAQKVLGRDGSMI